jgi:hypothetical protein
LTEKKQKQWLAEKKSLSQLGWSMEKQISARQRAMQLLASGLEWPVIFPRGASSDQLHASR